MYRHDFGCVGVETGSPARSVAAVRETEAAHETVQRH
jgi:hypothetical protein